MSINIEKMMVAFRFLDFITYAFPAPLPIYFNLVYSFCLVRLHRDGILGIECEKTVESGRMKTLCFDKTGTLTQDKMEVSKIIHIKEAQEREEIEDNSHDLISGLFACCNSVEMIGDEPKGDEIDLRLFIYSKAEI
jgi:cation-transporting P-type ATPase 13A2